MDHITTLITTLGRFVANDVNNFTLDLRRLKLLWQLVLGVEEVDGSFESLVINNTFFVLVSSFSAVGDFNVSRGQLETLDQNTGMNNDASLLIGVLNKVRKVVYHHSELVNDFSFQEFVTKLLIDDLDKSIEGSTVNDFNLIDCQDQIFLDCYKRGSGMLLMVFDETDSKEDIMKLLMTTSKKIVKSYLKAKRLIQVINFDKLVHYQQEIIDVMKYAFRKHAGYNDLLYEFFSENPIFPILSELNASTTQLLRKLDMPLLSNILTQICGTEKEKNIDIPITMEYMPQILKYYVNSLIEDGHQKQDIEGDFYIKMIKSCTLKWVDDIIDTEEYSKQLIDLSLVPSAMPYVYHGVNLPNIHMRRALYDLKEEIRLKDVCFNGWLQKSNGLPILLELESEWQFQKLDRIWKIITSRYNQIQKLSILADKAYDESIICKSLSKWVGKIVDLKELEGRFSVVLIQKGWKQWKRKSTELRRIENIRLDSIKISLLRRFFNSWKQAKEKQYVDQYMKFQTLQKRKFFLIWNSRILDHQSHMKVSEDLHQVSSKRKLWKIWKVRSKIPLSKIQSLDILGHHLVEKKAFNTWMQKYQLKQLLKKAIIKRDEVMASWMFTYWVSIGRLKMQEVKFVEQSSKAILHRNFDNWKQQHNMNQRAYDHYQRRKLQDALQTWRLKIRLRQFDTKKEGNLITNIFCDWKLKFASVQLLLKRNQAIKEHVFVAWKERGKNRVELALKADKLRKFYLKRLYYKIWKSYSEVVINLEIKMLEFQNRDNVDRAQLDNIFKLWKLNKLKRQRKRDELEKRQNIIKKRNMNKCLIIWRERFNTESRHVEVALDHYSNVILGRAFNKWLQAYDVLLDQYERFESYQDRRDVNNVKGILGKWAMKMIKIRNDERNCNEFLTRWDRQRQRVFWELWRVKPSFRLDMNPFDDMSAMSTPTPLEKLSTFTPRRSPRKQRSEMSLLQSVERVRRQELAERLERYKIKY